MSLQGRTPALETFHTLALPVRPQDPVQAIKLPWATPFTSPPRALCSLSPQEPTVGITLYERAPQGTGPVAVLFPRALHSTLLGTLGRSINDITLSCLLTAITILTIYQGGGPLTVSPNSQISKLGHEVK